MISFRPIARVIGVTLLLLGGLMLACLPACYYYHGGDEGPIALSALICIAFGAPLLFLFKSVNGKGVNKREGYLIVALGWLAMTLFGMLPFIFSGVLPGIADAFFETASGLTTTGATVITDIEGTPKGILLWRSLTHWIGGMGIIVLTVALFPLLGIGGVELFVAEAPGPTADKVHPRIRETAKRLWLIYVALTGLLILLLWAEGMTFFDAINHSMATMATGGFSTKNASIAYYTSPIIQYTIILFMFIAGINYTIIYYGLKGKLKKVWSSDEFRAYLILVLILAAGITIGVHNAPDIEQPLEKSFRDSLFQLVSVITTTGFITADYTKWSPGLTMLFFVLLFIGACAGSTAGGIKIIRHFVFFRNSFLEFKRLIHPRAIVPLKLNGEVVAGRILIHIFIFLLLYLILFVLGSLVLSILGVDFMTAVGAVATSLGNVGPGIGKVGPADNFAWLSAEVKWVLSFLMLLGRLEIFTILVLFTPYFWKSN